MKEIKFNPLTSFKKARPSTELQWPALPPSGEEEVTHRWPSFDVFFASIRRPLKPSLTPFESITVCFSIGSSELHQNAISIAHLPDGLLLCRRDVRRRRRRAIWQWQLRGDILDYDSLIGCQIQVIKGLARMKGCKWLMWYLDGPQVLAEEISLM